jgi:hypothetical protein
LLDALDKDAPVAGHRERARRPRLTSDAAKLRDAGMGRIERARQSVRNRMAAQLDKQALPAGGTSRS